MIIYWEKGRIDMLKKLSKYLIAFVVCLSLGIQVFEATTSEKTVDEKEYDIKNTFTIELQEELAEDLSQLRILNITDDGILAEILDVEALEDPDNLDFWETILISYDGRIFDAPIVFCDGIARVEYDGKYGYINENYEWIFRPIFDEAYDFAEKRALAEFDDTYMILNENGIEYIFPKGANVENAYRNYYKGRVLYSLNDSIWLWYNNKNVELSIPESEYDSYIDISESMVTESNVVIVEHVYGKFEYEVYHVFDKEGNWVYKVSMCDEMKMDQLVSVFDGYAKYNILQNGNLAINFHILSESGRMDKTQVWDNNGSLIASKDLTINGYTFPEESWRDLFWYAEDCYNSKLEQVDFPDMLPDNNDKMSQQDRIHNWIETGEHYIVLWPWKFETAYNNDYSEYDISVPDTKITIIMDSVANPKDEPSLADKGKVDKMLSQLTEETAVYINGEPLTFDVSPLMKNDRVLVPMRAIFEALGAEVDWNDELQCATAKKDGNVIDVTVGSDNMLKNNEIVSLDAEACMLNDRTLVPLRAVSEALEARVEWLGDSNSVVITTE